jgi:long-chain acyl-CoA synthetase
MTGRMLADVCDRLWSEQAGRVAIREGDTSVSFGELLVWSRALTRALEAEVREPASPVVLVSPNSAAFVAAFFAIARVGGVVAPLNPQYRSQELGYYFDDLQPAAVVTAPEQLPQVLEVLPGLARPPAVLELGRDRGCRVVRPGSDPRPVTLSDVTAPLLLQYTSGSTGAPKKVVRSHAMLCAELDALRSVFATSPADRFLGVAPFSHVNGLVRTMLSSMYAGATLYPIDGFRRRELLELVSRERLTFWGGVPQMFAILNQTPPRGQVDLSSLRIVFSSSAPLMPADHRGFQDRYDRVIRQLYGSTETGTISFNLHPDPRSNPDSVGAPLPGVEVQVVDADGRPAATGSEGELVIASPFAASGYFGNAEASRQSFRDGRYWSGDLGRKDEDGFLYITGRKKLLLNRGGFKVNPYEVEAAIAQHPSVRDVVVYGSPGPHGDDLVCCVIVPAGACTADDIIRHCRERIADYKIPNRIEFRESLPKSATGKVQRAQL